jgi:small GTP-binding protein
LPRIVIPSPTADVDDLDFGGPGGLEAKLVLLGSQGVGKTSLILRLTTGSFSAVPAPASLAGSFYKRKLAHNGVPIKLQIWDTAGQERFRSMAPIYYRGAHVCLLVYDISDRKSFQDVRSWLDELHSKASKDMIIYVVGAKTDLERQRGVS